MNSLRGEGSVTIDGKDFTVTLTMDVLARISQVVNADGLDGALRPIVAAEPNAIMTLLSAPANHELRDAVRGLADMVAVGKAAGQAITELMGEPAGNGKSAGKPKALKTS